MRTSKEKILTNVMLGAGLYLLDSLRSSLSEGVGDLSDRARDRAQDLYETASGRAKRASDVLRGEDHRGLSTTAAFLIGAGVGVGLGMLLAPASGEEIRSNISEKVRDRFSRGDEPSTGTYGT
jgi:YtxH-like protein